MKDMKFRVLCIIAAVWAGLFILTMRIKSPRLEQLDILVLFIGIAWFAYWTVSTVRASLKKDNIPVTETIEQSSEENKTNAEATVQQSPKS